MGLRTAQRGALTHSPTHSLHLPTRAEHTSCAIIVHDNNTQIGAVAHGSVDTSYCDEELAISGYAMSAAGVCAKVTGACEDAWGIH
jgi:rRNA pseudouridine-1189 N-methylase Emg1 (Nep1/Mra1 family)